MNPLIPNHYFLTKWHKAFSLLVSACLLMLPGICPGNAAETESVVLAQPGQPTCKIFLQEDWDSPDSKGPKTDVGYWQHIALREAVTDLQSYLEKITGSKIEVVKVASKEEITKPGIVLGKLAESLGTSPPKPSESGEGYRIQVADGLVKIAGDSEFGVQFGVYDFLGSLGCAWVFPGPEGDIVPSNPTLRIAVSDHSSEPAFSFRDIWWGGGAKLFTVEDSKMSNQWAVRNGLSGAGRLGLQPLDLRNGHFWGTLIRTFKSEFDAHPEMLALVRQPDGTLRRTGPQVESTDPRVVDLIVRYIDEAFTKNKWPHDKEVCFSVGPADGGGFSDSPESQSAMDGQIDPMTGDPDRTALVVLLADQVLAKIKEKYPNVYLGEYLYQVHGGFQTRYKVDPHFVLVIADIAYSRYHATLDHSSPSRNLFRNILDKWHQLKKVQGNPMYFRGYNYNLADCLLPYSKVEIWGTDIPYFHENGYEGFTIESVPSFAISAPSDYVLAKLGWNPSIKWADALHDYSIKAFGSKAGKYMEDYFVAQAEQQRKAGVETGSYWGERGIYSPAFVATAKELFDQADSVAENQQQKTLIHYFRYPVEYLDLFYQLFAARDRYDFQRTQALLTQIDETIAKAQAENPLITAQQAKVYLDRFWNKPVQKAAFYSSGDYAIQAKVPERLSTFIDVNRGGEQMELYRPEIDTSHYLQTDTYSTSWDQQGLGGLGQSSVWYFFKFDLNKVADGNRVGLFFGMIDGTSKVWINGKPVGERSGFGVPHIYDITDASNKSGANDAVVEIKKFGANEVGTGGIMWPAFIFSGPKIESPPVPSSERILPGGAREPVAP